MQPEPPPASQPSLSTAAAMPGSTQAVDGIAEPAPIGIDKASAVQRKRFLEAALGVDADRAVIRAQSLNDAASLCPVVTPIAGGVLLHGDCDADGRKITGSAKIVEDPTTGAKSYQFANFDLTMDGLHEKYDGSVILTGTADRPALEAERLKVNRSYTPGDEADGVTTLSLGRWFNDGRGHVAAFTLYPSVSTIAAVRGVGSYSIDTSLDLESQAGTVSLVFHDMRVTSAGNGACWKFSHADLSDVCDLDSLIVLDPR